MPDAYIAAARRTPIGRLRGTLAGISAAGLGAVAVAALLRETGIDPAVIDDVIMGQVLSGGAGQRRICDFRFDG